MFSQQTVENLQNLISESVKDPKRDIPGVSVSITNSKGDDLFQYAAGKESADSDEDLTTGSIFWLASASKFVTTIALLQLVDQGKVELDSSDQVSKYVPELSNLPIISSEKNKDELNFKPSSQKITLRHLLTHTSGLGYTFSRKILQKYGKVFNINELEAKNERGLLLPLLFEPGTNLVYGVGIDWAGVLLERITGKSLNDYLIENVFNPLGIEETGLEFDSETRKKFVPLSHRDKKGILSRIDHGNKKLFEGDYKNAFQAGGSSIFAKPKEYIKILASILNNGVSPKTGKRILQKETVDSLFVNQVPQFSNFGKDGIKHANDYLTKELAQLYPQGGRPQGWGFSMVINSEGSETGRGTNTIWWCGVANLFWWIDRENDVAGFLATQITPLVDVNVKTLWVKIEKEIYSDLQNGK
ncbi:hypothetical protein BN7_1506 [Wickerhamomyces ciferrii]|uniref:Beta-lactamase-related domain-containing protein n=1 Tax=Wickerhamomyces ciferrii (strain ATCC 14091 / BCRC 22168 / CBS 111 / JCM 3599 / NBRC 0793 / NRRL Y-1031 F-60-10) TaxID=1206466 RepID=K0KIG1_WICCF|nr:uncharacterized protein BN7_1506 [Wickerhamomyces ciferrii]CCH41967.1 hypothetical protein BN7_1506 [Wickerhamomyces ciferrii]